MTATVPTFAAESELIARSALPSYGISSEAVLRLVSVSENALYEVVGLKRALRVHRAGYRSRPEIVSELSWVGALRRDLPDLHVPGVVRNIDGHVVTELPESRLVTVFDWIDGTTASDTDIDRWIGEIGAISARLHVHAQQWAPPIEFCRATWGFDEQLGPNGHWGRWQDGLDLDASGIELIGRCASVIDTRLRRFGRSRKQFGLVHSDLRAANLMVTGGAVGAPVLTVIDFDDCGYGWFLYDLAATLSFIEDRPDVPELVDRWVAGYRTVTPITADEVRELPTFIAMRRILLTAWIASHPEAEMARELGASFTAGTLTVAENFLSRHP